jgi:2-polyprenyl-3-methyl-5-hydroxy-6-metoxy-1,4-benzoquinol methylase
MIAPDHAELAYDVFERHYDAFIADHDYEAWAATIEQLAHRHRLCGSRLLDVACGTGKSLEPFVRRGYTAVGCDLSQPMLDVAAAKLGARVRLERHDLRDLPRLGAFDLVRCLDMPSTISPPAMSSARRAPGWRPTWRLAASSSST